MIIHLHKYLNQCFQKHVWVFTSAFAYITQKWQSISSMGILSPSSVHDMITKKQYLFSLFLKYFFTLPPTTFFCREQKRHFTPIIGQQQEKILKSEGEKMKLLFCASGGHALVKSLLMSPDYFFLTYCLMIFLLSLWGSLSSFYSLQPQEFHNNCYKVMLFLELYFFFDWFK